MKYFTSAVICAFTIIGFTQSSSATVLDFEAAALDNGFVNDQGDSYSEDGFTINETGRYTLSNYGLQESRFV